MGINSFFGRNGNEKDKIIPFLFDHQITSKNYYFRVLKTRKFFEVYRLEQPLRSSEVNQT